MKCAACQYEIQPVAFVDGPQRVFVVVRGERVHVQCPDFAALDETPGEGMGMAVSQEGDGS